MKTTKADEFTSTHGDQRPNGPSQQYPYSLVNKWRGNTLVVAKGDKVRRGTPFSQAERMTQTLFQVEAGESQAKSQPGIISFEGSVSFEDLKRWRENGLAITGFSPDFTGAEPFMRVIAAQVQSL